MNADGRGVRNRTRHPAQDNYATWSPDGKRLAFISDRDGGHDVYLMEVKKNQLHLLPRRRLEDSKSKAY